MSLVGPSWDKTRQDHLVVGLIHQGLQPSSINRYLAVLDSVGAEVKYLPVEDRERRVLSSEELETLDARVRQRPEHKCRMLYAVLRDTGCRGREELGRTISDWSRVDFSAKTINFLSFKGKRAERVVPMNSVAEQALSWAYYQPEVPLPSDAEWRRFWAAVRLDNSNRPYDLRHTFCSRLLERGIPPVSVMRIMGHSSLNMTLHYQHIRPSTLEAVRQALE